MAEGVRAVRSAKVVPEVAQVFKKSDGNDKMRKGGSKGKGRRKRLEIPGNKDFSDSEVSSLSRGYSFSKYSQLVTTEADQREEEEDIDESLDEGQTSSGMEDVKATSTLFNKLRDADLACLGLCSIGCVAGVFATEMEYKRNTDNEDVSESSIIFLLLISSVSTFCLILSLFFRKMIYADWQREKSMLKMGPIKWKTALGLIPEIILCLPHPNVLFFDVEYVTYNEPLQKSIHYEFNSVLNSLQLFLRLYIPLRACIMFSSYSSGRSQRVCSINGAESNFHFVVKALMKERPSLPLMLSFVSSILLCSYTMRNFERPVGEERGQDFGDLRNATWCVILTMTSVGYGDYYPVTDEGRFIGTISAILGFMLLSLMFVTLNNLLEFEISERKAFTFLYRLGEKQKLRKAAARVISLAYYSRRIRRIYTEDSRVYKEAFNQFRKRMFEFKILSRRIRGLYISTEEIDILEREIDMMHDKFYDLERDMNTIKSDHLNMNTKMDTFLELLRSRVENQRPNHEDPDRTEEKTNLTTDFVFESEE